MRHAKALNMLAISLVITSCCSIALTHAEDPKTPELLSIEASMKQLNEETFQLSTELKAIQDTINVHNQEASQVESACLQALTTRVSNPGCNDSILTIKQKADALNAQEDAIRNQLAAKHAAFQQLKDKHDNLVHALHVPSSGPAPEPEAPEQ